MSLVDKLLNPKNIILNAIKNKLEGTGIINIVIVFNILTDKYTVLLTDKDNKRINIDIDENEVSLIKKMFISKIIKKFSQDEPDKEINKVIVKIDINNSIIDVFIEDKKEVVTKFNY